MSCRCGCCAGIESRTPQSVGNAPGLEALRRRIGRHDTFLDSMLARLSSSDGAALHDLRTRVSNDPAIAFLDGGATLLDILTFYQERLANEGYLRTATERRSLIELARLVGYRPRPGLAASTYLAFTVEQEHRLTIPKGTKAQNVPGPGELPQTFETSEDLEARAEWNQLTPRRMEPQIEPAEDEDSGITGALALYLKGTSTGLKKNDPILIEQSPPELYRVVSVDADVLKERTKVVVRPWRDTTLAEDVVGVIDAWLAKATAAMLGSTTVGGLVNATKELRESASKESDQDHLVGPIKDALAIASDVLKQLGAGATNLKPWVTELETALEALLNKAARVAGSTANGKDPRSMYEVASLPPTLGPRNTSRLPRSLEGGLGRRAGGSLGVVTSLQPALRGRMASLVQNQKVSQPTPLKVYALRIRAALFGHNAPMELTGFGDKTKVPEFNEWSLEIKEGSKFVTSLDLDAKYETIAPDSWIVIDAGTPASLGLLPGDPRPNCPPPFVTRAVSVDASIALTEFGIAGPSTHIALESKWILFPPPPPAPVSVPIDASSVPPGPEKRLFAIIRKTAVYAGSELLDLAEAPIEDPLCKGASEAIELSDLQIDLAPGRWVIVAGERTDIPGTSGVAGAELAMISEVRHDVRRDKDEDGNGKVLPGESNHTYVTLASDLAYCYRRETATIHGNVVHATHGETRKEPLGAGNGAEPFQRFVLKASPLTFTAAPTAEGAESTLEVRVNDVLWHERETLVDAKPTDHVHVTTTDDEARTTIVGGDGWRGARFPTGRENVRAVYRTGIGRPGNVGERKISLLASKPLGVKEVINPLPATGGADADSRDQLRRNIPIGLQALDRLVSVRDYADFARAFAGIGKAVAVRLPGDRSGIVHVTIAGADDIPILETSDLFRNLLEAFHSLGAPRLFVEVAVRERLLLVIGAGVRIDADYEWEKVEPKIRKALYETFSFEHRDLGQGASASEVLAAIQRVPGVVYVDLDAFGGIPERKHDDGPPARRRLITPEEVADEVDGILHPTSVSSCGWPRNFCPVVAHGTRLEGGLVAPAELATLSSEVPETLVLKPLP